MDPSDFMNCATFLASLAGLTSPSSLFFQVRFSSHLPPTSYSFPGMWSTFYQRVLADSSLHWHGHFEESKPGTFFECENFLTPILSVPICTTNLCIFFTSFFVGFGLVEYNFLPVFSLVHASSYSSRAFCSEASSIVVLLCLVCVRCVSGVPRSLFSDPLSYSPPSRSFL